MADNQYTEAAAELAQTFRETYQTVVERAVAAQERNVKVAQTLIESGIEELKSQSETARSVFQSFTPQADRQPSVRDTYQSVVSSAAATQERNVKLAQNLVESGIEELKSQTDSAQSIIQTLAQQAEKQRQAVQTIAHESMDAYVNFLFAPFSFYQKGLEAARQATQQSGF
jgi:polyhydroxyalkanoate synthesis regulator phasin